MGKRNNTGVIRPALHRPERFELERLADDYVNRRTRRERVVASSILGGIAACLVLGFLAALGVL